MLFLHETHCVIGAREDEFEAAYREGWMPTLAKGDDARLLWYTNHAHGSGVSYNVVTITGITDGAAWERLARRAQTGDLQPWMRELDNLRHEVTGKIMLPVEWSPLQEVDLAKAGEQSEVWEKVIRKLRAGVMPPPDVPRPPLRDYEALRDWLEHEIDRAAAGNGVPVGASSNAAAFCDDEDAAPAPKAYVVAS